jgi:hypothetical protein
VVTQEIGTDVVPPLTWAFPEVILLEGNNAHHSRGAPMLSIRWTVLLLLPLGAACISRAADDKPEPPRELWTNEKAKPASLLGAISPTILTPVPVQTLVALNVAAPWPQPGSEVPGALSQLYNVSGKKSFLCYLARVGEKTEGQEANRDQRRDPEREKSRMGEFHCLATEYGLDPVIMVVVRDSATLESAPVLRLLQELDRAVARNNLRRLHAFLVLLDPTVQDVVKEDVPRYRLQKKVEALVEDEKNKLNKGNDLIFTISSPNYFKDYFLDETAAVTVVFYKTHRVWQTNTFPKDKLTEDDVTKLLGEGLPKLLPPR